MILEYCNGENLKEYIKNKGGKLSQIETFQILKEMIDAYKVLYHNNIIHRDIKPENIMIHNN